MPAMNCARPPNIAANGASASGDCGVPHQPARFDATMKVAPANPARRGRADGDRRPRGRSPERGDGTLLAIAILPVARQLASKS